MDGAATSTAANCNSTESSGSNEESSGSLLLVMASLALATVIIIFNSLMIYVIRKTETLQTLSNMYISSLAHVDLMVGLGLLPIASFFVTDIKREYFEKYIRLCVFMNSFSIGATFMSTLHLMIISIDRCLYIKMPYFYAQNFNRSRVIFVIAFIWIAGAFDICLPQLLTSGSKTTFKCDTTLVMPIEYIFSCNFTVFATSMVVSLAMYGIILNTAAKQRRQINSLHVPVHKNAAGADGIFVVFSKEEVGQDVDLEPQNNTMSSAKYTSIGLQQGLSLKGTVSKVEHTSSHTEIQKELQNLDKASNKVRNQSFNPRFESHSHRLQNSMKNIKFFATVFGVFVVCLTPSMVCMPLDYYVTVPPLMYNAASLMAFTNSAANFLIFCWLNSTFRKAVSRTVRCSSCKRN